MHMKIILNEEDLKKAISHYLRLYAGVEAGPDKLIIEEIEERVTGKNKKEIYMHIEIHKTRD